MLKTFEEWLKEEECGVNTVTTDNVAQKDIPLGKKKKPKKENDKEMKKE